MRRENTSAVAAAVISATIADHTRSSDARGPTYRGDAGNSLLYESAVRDGDGSAFSKMRHC